MLIEMGEKGIIEDWLVTKPKAGKPWFAQDKHSKRKVIVADDSFENARIEHRRAKQVDPIGDPIKSVLTAKLDGVVVYIRGDEIVLARAPKIVKKLVGGVMQDIYETEVVI